MTNTIMTDRDPTMWQYPDVSANTAEMQQHNYADFLAAPAPAESTEAQNTPDQLESVPAAGELVAYTDRNGQPVDPHAAEAVLQAVDQIYADMPEAQASALRQEHHHRAVLQADAYAAPVIMLREQVLNSGEQE